MSNKDLEFPRMVYRGDPDEKEDDKDPDTYEGAETKVVHNQDELDAALKDGWRLHRMEKGSKEAKAADKATAEASKDAAKADEPKGKK